MRHDVTFPLYVEVDEIYNLACPASPVHYQHDPVQTTKTSVHGAINMLGLAKRVRAKIFQASTSEVYGDPDGASADRELLGQRQSDRVRAPATTRASAAPRRCSSTITASTSCASRWRASSTPTARACIPNDGRVVSNFIVQALKGEDITIYGDGTQTRSFCYVDDLIDGLLRLMDHAPDDFTGPVNIGNPDEIPIRQLAEKILDKVGGKGKLVFAPLPVDDPMQRCPDITLAREKLKWEPKVALDQGLTKTIAFFDELLKSNRDVSRVGR